MISLKVAGFNLQIDVAAHNNFHTRKEIQYLFNLIQGNIEMKHYSTEYPSFI